MAKKHYRSGDLGLKFHMEALKTSKTAFPDQKITKNPKIYKKVKSVNQYARAKPRGTTCQIPASEQRKCISLEERKAQRMSERETAPIPLRKKADQT